MTAPALSTSLAPDRGSPTLELLRLSMPMIGLTVSRMLMGFIDTFMVAKLGTAALAAISPSTLLLFAISCLGMGMAQGVQTFVAQADGRGEPHRAGPYVWQTLYIALASAVLTAPIVITLPIWFEWFGAWAQHPADVRAMEISFLSIALWSIGPATVCAGLEAFYNGIRRPAIGFVAVTASLVTITIGNYVLIFGKLGFPALGIAGSAISTVVSWGVRALVLFVPLFWSSIDARFHTRRSAALHLARLREIVRLGWPISMQWLVDIGAWVVFLHMMMPPYGAIAMAAATNAIQFMHLSFMPPLGIGMALTTQVGNEVGAGHPERAGWRVRVARRVIVGYMGVMAILFVFGGATLARLFTADPAVILATAHVLVWAALFQVSDGLCITYSFALRGAGDTRAPAVLFAACCWGIFVVGGYAMTRLAPQLGVNGPWSMCMLYIVVLGVLLWWRFRSEAWRRIRLFSEAAGAFPVVVEEAGAAPVATGSP